MFVTWGYSPSVSKRARVWVLVKEVKRL